MNPKILVISNNCFSQSNSNGRTLGNFFIGWPKECLAQFYIQNSEPDFCYCNNYFRVTDTQALKAFLFRPCKGGIVAEPSTGKSGDQAPPLSDAKPVRKNALTLLFRNVIWQSGRWRKSGFDAWVDAFVPDVILLQAGDFAFMYLLAASVAKRHRAKLMIYNSEGYYFNSLDCYRSTGLAKLIYPFFHKKLKKALAKAYRQVDYIVYANDELKRAYDSEFDTRSEVLYTVTETVPRESVPPHDGVIISYCGNLGLNRHLGLIEVAAALQEISPVLHIDVYGKAKDRQVEDALSQAKGIRFHGLVSYEEVGRILSRSDLLLHVEQFDPRNQAYLRFGFSTKIADTLASGACFLLYAPEQLACSRYLIENQAAYVVTQKDDLVPTLRQIVSSPEARTRYIPRALELARENHSKEKNTLRFQNILKSL